MFLTFFFTVENIFKCAPEGFLYQLNRTGKLNNYLLNQGELQNTHPLNIFIHLITSSLISNFYDARGLRKMFNAAPCNTLAFHIKAKEGEIRPEIRSFSKASSLF